MKYKLLFLLLLATAFTSCNAPYYVAVSNKSSQPKEIQICTSDASITYYQNLPSEKYQFGEEIARQKIDMGKYISIVVPANQTVVIETGSMAIAKPYSCSIIVDNDTIQKKEFINKRKSLTSSARKYYYLLK